MPDHAVALVQVKLAKFLYTYALETAHTLPPVCRETNFTLGQRMFTATNALSTIAELTSTRFSGLVP